MAVINEIIDFTKAAAVYNISLRDYELYLILVNYNPSAETIESAIKTAKSNGIDLRDYLLYQIQQNS